MFNFLRTLFVNAGFGFLLFVSTATAQDAYTAPGHEENHHFYQQVQRQLGVKSCCDEKSRDCGPVADYKDLGAGAGTRVLLEDKQWHETLRANKYYVDTPDGRAHVCRQPARDNYGNRRQGFHFYCVFLPNPSI